MTCPPCESTATHRRKRRTALGYRRFSCAGCQRRFNELTGTPFNELQFPTDIVLLAVLWRLRYKLGCATTSGTPARCRRPNDGVSSCPAGEN